MEKADFGGKGKPDAWRIKAGVSQSLEALPSVRAQRIYGSLVLEGVNRPGQKALREMSGQRGWEVLQTSM